MADVLEIELKAEKAIQLAKELAARLDKVEKEGYQSAKGMSSAEKAAAKLGKTIGRTLGAYASYRTISALISKTVQNTVRQENAIAQIEARLRSTNDAVGYSVDELAQYAAELQRVTTFGDEEILEMQGILMTFTNVTGETFKQATKAILDTSVALGTDLKSAALQVGKALNDPIAGLGALSRSGVQFTDTQKEMIRTLVESNRMVEAQAMMLEELETQMGGAAEAAADTLGGSLQQLGNIWGDLFEATPEQSSGLRDAIQDLADQITDKDFQRAAENFKQFLLDVAEYAVRFAGGLADAVGGIQAIFTRYEEMRRDALTDAERDLEAGAEAVALAIEAGNEEVLAFQANIDEFNRLIQVNRQQMAELIAGADEFDEATASNNQAVQDTAASTAELIGQLNMLRESLADLENRQIEISVLWRYSSLEMEGPPRPLDWEPGWEPPPPEPPSKPVVIGGTRRSGGGGKRAGKSPEQELAEDYQKLQESLFPLVKLEREHKEALELLNKVEEKQIKSVEGEIISHDELQKALAAVNKEYDEKKKKIIEDMEGSDEWQKTWEDSLKSFSDGFSTYFVDAIMDGKASWEDFVRSFVAGIAKMILQKHILEPAMKAMGWLPSESGNVFRGGGLAYSPHVVPHGAGGIVSTPMMFPMSGNKIGSIAETEPEAIMPLDRKNGRLGLGVTPVNVTTNIVNNAPVKVREETTQDRNGNVKTDIFIEEAMRKTIRSGKMDDVFASEYGIARRGY